MLENEWSEDGIFNLQAILDMGMDKVADETNVLLKMELEKRRQQTIAGLLKDVTFFKEIIVTKEHQYEDEEWLRQKRANPDKTPTDKDGNEIARKHTSKRDERIIVTYSHD